MRDKGDPMRELWLTPDKKIDLFNFRQSYELISQTTENNPKFRKKIPILFEQFGYSKEADLILELIEKIKEGIVLPSLPLEGAEKEERLHFLDQLKALFVDEEQKEKACTNISNRKVPSDRSRGTASGGL